MRCGRQRQRKRIRSEGFQVVEQNHEQTRCLLDGLDRRHPAWYGDGGVSMKPASQTSGSAASDDFDCFILPRGVAGFVAAPYTTIAGKLSRCLARNVTTKKLVMR